MTKENHMLQERRFLYLLF